MNRSLAARWSLLSGSGQLYLLWPSQASLYRSPIHQHPFFSLQQRLAPTSTIHISNNGALPFNVLCFCFVVFSPVLCCHSRGKPPILCLTPLDFPPLLGIHTLPLEKEKILMLVQYLQLFRLKYQCRTTHIHEVKRIKG